MSYSQVINKAREIRDLYFSPDYPLQTAFKKIFEDNNISILFQENGEMLKKLGIIRILYHFLLIHRHFATTTQ